MGEKAFGIIVAVLIAGGLVWWQFGKKDGRSDEVHQRAVEVIESLDHYPGHERLYLDTLEANHERIFDAHYMIGGRRTRARFDEDEYWAELYATMAAGLRDAGCRECGLDFVELFEAHTGTDLDERPSP